MKDIVSILLTTTCLGIAGIGIYFYSLNSEENTFDNQKAGKKINTVYNKKEIEEVKDNYDDNDYNDQYNIDDNSIKSNYKIKTKSNNNKTKKNTNKLNSSKKQYYY